MTLQRQKNPLSHRIAGMMRTHPACSCAVAVTHVTRQDWSAGADVKWRERLGETRVAAAEAAREAASAAARGVISSDQVCRVMVRVMVGSGFSFRV